MVTGSNPTQVTSLCCWLLLLLAMAAAGQTYDLCTDSTLNLSDITSNFHTITEFAIFGLYTIHTLSAEMFRLSSHIIKTVTMKAK
jgi:hypothetical protein